MVAAFAVLLGQMPYNECLPSRLEAWFSGIANPGERSLAKALLCCVPPPPQCVYMPFYIINAKVFSRKTISLRPFCKT